MQNFSTNIQFNIAQMNSLANEQEKLKSVSKKQQQEIGQKVEKIDEHHQYMVEATEEKNDATKVKDENLMQENEDELLQDENKKNKKHDEKKVIFLKDEEKGNLVDFTG